MQSGNGALTAGGERAARECFVLAGKSKALLRFTGNADCILKEYTNTVAPEYAAAKISDSPKSDGRSPKS